MARFCPLRGARSLRHSADPGSRPNRDAYASAIAIDPYRPNG